MAGQYDEAAGLIVVVAQQGEEVAGGFFAATDEKGVCNALGCTSGCGPGVFKVDLAVEGGVPWRDPEVGRAGTVHLGGDAAAVVANEAVVARGRMPERPFVLLGQQYVADPSRSRGDVHPVYTYAHVPAGYTGDATEAILAQVERFAPGFRDRVVDTYVTRPADFESFNPNWVGGDILTGAKDPVSLLLGPRPGRNPYRTGAKGVYLCSAAAPPGPGAYGMAGHLAAGLALRDLRRT